MCWFTKWIYWNLLSNFWNLKKKTTSQLFSEKIATDNCALNEDGLQFLIVLSPIVLEQSSVLFYLKPSDSYLFVWNIHMSLTQLNMDVFRHAWMFEPDFGNKVFRSLQIPSTANPSNARKAIHLFCWVIWIHHGLTFCRSSSSFFFGPGTILVVTTKQQLLKPQEIQVVAGLDSVDLGRKRTTLSLLGFERYTSYTSDI